LILYTDGLLDAYAKLVDDTDLGIGELVDAVTTCASDGAEAHTWIPTLVSSAPHLSADDTAVVVITTRPSPGS
jgi:hypothetical protein